ncbi:MAG: hypothetical protein IT487_13660 [Chromatiaceae bacterium]|nr:hypothetical protein [Chromatiaceae bacterium]
MSQLTYIISLLTVAAWLTFVYVGAKSKNDYLSVALSPLAIGVVADWKNEENYLYFKGFSGPEPTHRWSNISYLNMCYLLPTDSMDSWVFSVKMDIRVVSDLVGENIMVRANRGEWISNVCKSQGCELNISVAPPSNSQIICLELQLPKTVRVEGDPRALGIQFFSLEYEIQKPPAKAGGLKLRTESPDRGR